ncbi:MAG TPA: hypothetical protein VHC69_26115 [Polyangiaceae bacterium]|nr:hypothetical protein [Polyangiaceae bacterium]
MKRTPKKTSLVDPAARDFGVLVFVALCFFGSWLVAAALRALGVTVAPAAFGTRPFTVSLLSVATMGWQPIIGPWSDRRLH